MRRLRLVGLGALLCAWANIGPAPRPGEAAPRLLEAEWTPLIASRWSFADRGEKYQCERLTMTRDMYVTGFHPVQPPGTHHTVVSVGPRGGADGTTACGAATNQQGMIWASGVGTEDLLLPPGVAIKISAGQQLVANFHLFNETAGALSGTSGAEVRLIPPAQVQHEAEALLAGTTSLTVPAGVSTQQGTCTMTGDVTIFGAWPHMHVLGTHLKSVANSSIVGTKVLFDGHFSFSHQHAYLLPASVPMKTGDTVDVFCTYDNTTGRTVTYGESTANEMCFSGLYRFPKIGAGDVACTE